MQGRFKTAGGKLVVVDFEVEQGRLRNVVIHGDFFVYPEEAYTLELAEHACLHEWHVCEYPERHPLHTVDVAIAGSAGDGVIRRLGERGVSLLTTGESDPARAVKAYLADDLTPGAPHDEHSCGGEGHQVA